MGHELKRCPLCAAKAELFEEYEYGHLRYGVRCKDEENCGSAVFGFKLRGDAIDAWNRRDG